MIGFKHIGRLLSRRFLLYFVVPNILFAIVASLTKAGPFIGVLNLVAIALSVNVCVAFAPNVLDVVFTERPVDKADLLSLGIFCSWFALVLRTSFSLVWRYLGEPRWLNDTDFTSYFVFMAVCAAVFHLAAPGSVKESIPPQRWIKIGAIAAAAVFVALLLLYTTDMQGRPAADDPHDKQPSRTGMVVPL